MQSPHQHQGHSHEGQRGGERRVVGYRHQFFAVHGLTAGHCKTHTREVRREFGEQAMQLADSVFGGPQAIAAVGRIDQHEGAVRPAAAYAGEQLVTPVHGLTVALRMAFERHAQLIEHAGQLPALTVVEFTLEAEAQGIEQARQTGIVGQRAEQRLGAGQAIGQIPQRIGVEIEQAMAREVLTATGLREGVGDIAALAQTRAQGIGGVLGLTGVGRFGIDHHIARQARKGGIQRVAGAHMGQLGVEHIAGIGIDVHMRDGVPAGHHAQREAQQQHQHGVAHTGRDDGAGRVLRQGLPLHVYDRSGPRRGQREGMEFISVE